GNAGDDLTVAALPDFTRTLVVGSSASPFDQVTVSGAVSLAAGYGLSAGATDITFVNASADVTAPGAGSVTPTGARTISLAAGSSITTTDGGITLTANAAGTAAGNFAGLDLNDADLVTTGAGSIALTAQGGDDAFTNSHRGIYLHGGATVISAGTG